MSHSSHHCCQQYSEYISQLQDSQPTSLPKETQPLFQQPSPSCHHHLSSDAHQEKQQKQTTKSDASPLDPHSQACALPCVAGWLLCSLPVVMSSYEAEGRNGEAASCGSSPGSNQQRTKELTLSWRKLYKLLSNCSNRNHSKDLQHTIPRL